MKISILFSEQQMFVYLLYHAVNLLIGMMSLQCRGNFSVSVSFVALQVKNLAGEKRWQLYRGMCSLVSEVPK